MLFPQAQTIGSSHAAEAANSGVQFLKLGEHWSIQPEGYARDFSCRILDFFHKIWYNIHRRERIRARGQLPKRIFDWERILT